MLKIGLFKTQKILPLENSQLLSLISVDKSSVVVFIIGDEPDY